MGPRSIDRGNDTAPRHPPGALEGFNGAAIDRSRKSIGAVTTPFSVSLQWGRDRSIAEMGSKNPRGGRAGCFNGAAIDRSRKYGGDWSCRRVDARFNGA